MENNQKIEIKYKHIPVWLWIKWINEARVYKSHILFETTKIIRDAEKSYQIEYEVEPLLPGKTPYRIKKNLAKHLLNEANAIKFDDMLANQDSMNTPAFAHYLKFVDWAKANGVIYKGTRISKNVLLFKIHELNLTIPEEFQNFKPNETPANRNYYLPKPKPKSKPD